jgi:stearoyl-CoA desaturase (delta-9 desaturase)
MVDYILRYGFGYLNVLPLWQYVVITLVLTQITIFSVTLYLHRNQSHRAIDLHPLVSHFCRLWLWLTTGMNTKAWVAIHRKHHAKSETVDDPHSPLIYGIKKLLLEGVELYRQAPKKDPELLSRYGKNTPQDWLEKSIYTPYGRLGVILTLLCNVVLFGVPGVTIWAVQMAWIPMFAAGGINGIGHYWGYRNFNTHDTSRNIYPIAFFIGGEELHNNHHTYANSAKFSVHWWEFDIGWLAIRILQALRLAKANYVPPKPAYVKGKTVIDADTIKALMRNRFQVLADYTRQVMAPVFKDEESKADDSSKKLLEQASKPLLHHVCIFDQQLQESVEQTIKQYSNLAVVYQFGEQLQTLWQQTTCSQKELINKLHAWCQQAETSGIKALVDFTQYIKTYAIPAN